jgi:transcriptional regulator with XRE-family HTH domain
MSELIEQAEAVRRRLGLRQVEVAAALGVTQGHYSKIANARAPLPRGLADKMSNWVGANLPDGLEAREMLPDRMAMLAASIQRQCLELVQLSARAIRSAKATSHDDDVVL